MVETISHLLHFDSIHVTEKSSNTLSKQLKLNVF
jgi:hypothetical protein